jgi:HTH-type transcriptional regulator/antitoxin HigA
MGETRMPPESPGERVKVLMAERNWSQAELAYVLGVTTATVNQVVNSKRPITPEMAKLLGVAFDRPAEEFADLQARWSLSQAADPDDEVRARAFAQSKFPLREMVKRGWINDPKEAGGAHGELCRFFGVNTLDSVPSLAHAAKKTGVDGPTGEQLAWLYRVRAIASEMPTPAYTKAKLQHAIDRMSAMRLSPEEIRHVPRLLHEAGVRFVAVEGLPGGRIDGVCTWLDSDSPVIGMSLRFDRIDNFWFVLRHECAHVMYGHGKSVAIIDSDLSMSAEETDEEEIIANKEAADFCVSAEKMRSFYVRKNPFFSESDVKSFAKMNNVHPGLVVGQLQYMTKEYRSLRQYLVNVRKFVTSSAMTDGWGNFVPVS